MTKFLQIVFLIVVTLWHEADNTPLFQGIKFQRGFELSFKPLPRKPLTFLKEKWSPFGVFGRLHSIQKRSSGVVVVPVEEARPAPIVPRPIPPAAPVFEYVEEPHLHRQPFLTLHNQSSRSVVPLVISSPVGVPIAAQPPVSPGPPIIISSSASPPMPLSVIVTPAPLPVINNVSPIANDVKLEGALPPLSSNMVIPPRRFTDISKAEPVRKYMESNQGAPPLAPEEKVPPPLETNSIKPEVPKSDIVLNDSSLVRGSKMALYFGSIFLQLMSQFMSNARATFDQMTARRNYQPPPVYNN
uniref:Uncharacterized protein n=1 Tax=Heliothis virescens TaxID=7102 RepID=A0A2A4JMP6_HELVI